jgi:hypothetical protein
MHRKVEGEKAVLWRHALEGNSDQLLITMFQMKYDCSLLKVWSSVTYTVCNWEACLIFMGHNETKKGVSINTRPEMSGFWVYLKYYIQKYLTV